MEGRSDLRGEHDVVRACVVKNNSRLSFRAIVVGEDDQIESVGDDLEARLLGGSSELLHEGHHIVHQLHRVQSAFGIEDRGHHSLFKNFKVGTAFNSVLCFHNPTAHHNVPGADHVLGATEILDTHLQPQESARREGGDRGSNLTVSTWRVARAWTMVCKLAVSETTASIP
jgi:hypothetical protein